MHIAISVLPDTHFQSSEAFEGEVPRTQHRNNVPFCSLAVFTFPLGYVAVMGQ